MVGLWRWSYSVKLLIYSLDKRGSWDAINYLSPRICLIRWTQLAFSLWSNTIAGSLQFTVFLKNTFIRYLLFADRFAKQLLQFIPSNAQVLVNPENQLFRSDNSAAVCNQCCNCCCPCPGTALSPVLPHHHIQQTPIHTGKFLSI